MSSTSAQGITALSSTLLGLSTIAIGLRFYIRHVQKMSLKKDDWITIPCLILFIGTTATTFYGVNKKVVGYPTPTDPREKAETAAMTSKLYIAFDFFSISTLGCVKICALLFYRRIFCVPNSRTIFQALTLITIGVVALWTIAFLILTGLQCGTHFSALWTGIVAQMHYCHIAFPFLLSLTISDFLLDVWIISLPLFPIWKLQASPGRRLSIFGVFLLALVGLAACIARLVTFVEIENSRNVKHDARLINTKAIYLSVLETGLSLIAVNLPSLWFLFSKVSPESVLRSVRSMISLGSDRSAASHHGRGGAAQSYPSSLAKKQSNSNSSQSHFAHPDAQCVQSYAMHDLEHKEHGPKTPTGGIRVTDRISLSAEEV